MAIHVSCDLLMTRHLTHSNRSEYRDILHQHYLKDLSGNPIQCEQHYSEMIEPCYAWL